MMVTIDDQVYGALWSMFIVVRHPLVVVVKPFRDHYLCRSRTCSRPLYWPMFWEVELDGLPISYLHTSWHKIAECGFRNYFSVFQCLTTSHFRCCLRTIPFVSLLTQIHLSFQLTFIDWLDSILHVSTNILYVTMIYSLVWIIRLRFDPP